MRNAVVFWMIFVKVVDSVKICPKHIGEVDSKYDITNRFNNVVQQSDPILTASFIHKRNKVVDEYDYTVKFCGEKDEVAVTQKEKIKNVSGATRAIGKFDNASQLLGGEDILLVHYKHGDQYSRHCSHTAKNTWIIIRCESRGKTPTLKVIEEGRFTKDASVDPDPLCYFAFEYNHPAACSKFPKKMSGGAIFCIVLLSGVGAYLVLGFLYMRFVVGAKGLGQIPNYGFWRMIGNASADGCDFVCRRQEQSNTYKGMADALHIDDSSDNDDGLLPM